MKPTIKYDIEETLVQVIHDDGEVVVKRGVWVEGEGLCAIYDLDENWFPYVCTINFRYLCTALFRQFNTITYL